MTEEKKCNCSRILFILLVINTLLLVGIFFKLCCLSASTGYCPMMKKGSGYICPYAQKGSMKGSPAQ